MQGLPLWLSLWGGGRVHWVQVVGSLRCVRLLWSCVPPFVRLLSAFLLCVWWDACKYALISRFKGVFGAVSLVGCMFVLLACFAWLVGLLCA